MTVKETFTGYSGFSESGTLKGLTQPGFDRDVSSVLDSEALSGPGCVSNISGTRRGFSMSCSIEGCGKTGRLVRGMCMMHYTRWLKYGDVTRDYRGRGPGPYPECSLAACQESVGRRGAKGLCPRHYKRFSKYGTTDLPAAYVVPTCSADECETRAWARGLCQMHYARWRTHGHLDSPIRSLAERLWPRVDKSAGLGPNGDCWEWTGWRHRGGHGQILGADGKLIYTHRAVWELEGPAIPEGLCVCHRCDNPPCVRRSHLFLGTNDDNMADMRRKGRGWWQKAEHPLEATALGLSRRREA